MKDVTKKFRKTCEKCNKPFNTADENITLCRECRMRENFAARHAEEMTRKENEKKGAEIFETRKCVDCGDEFTITNREHAFYESHGYSLPLRCPECRRLHRDFEKRGLDNIGLEDVCVECGAKIQFTNRDLYWYASHDYKIPTRCKNCRKERNERFAKIAASKATSIVEDEKKDSVENAEVPNESVPVVADAVEQNAAEQAVSTEKTPDANDVSA